MFVKDIANAVHCLARRTLSTIFETRDLREGSSQPAAFAERTIAP